MKLYPDAEFIDAWYDFKLHGTFVEVKDCFRNNNGRYTFFAEHHEELIKEGGWYFFVLKKKQPGSLDPKIQYVKWVPALVLEPYDQFNVMITKSHRTDYIQREVFRISWKWVWNDISRLDRTERGYHGTPIGRFTRESDS